MSTFLQLVNDVERESGTVNITSRSTDVTAPGSGRQEKIISHVKRAWELIQNSRTDWPWMQVETTKVLTIGQARYDAITDFALTNFARWDRPTPYLSPISIYDTPLGLRDEGDLDFRPYSEWKTAHGRGFEENGRPYEYSMDAQRRLCVGPPPDKAYTIRGTYYRKPQILAVNGDEPICPPEHHQVIVWQALMLLHGHDEGQFSLQFAQSNFAAAFRALVNDRDDFMED